MTVQIEAVAKQGGMSEAGGGWGPCPACRAERRGKHDKRGPVNLTRAATTGALAGQPAWKCHTCGEGGGLKSLGRLLDVTVPGETPAEPAPLPQPTAGPVDVASGWSALGWGAATWMSRLRAWMARQGFTPEMSRAVEQSGQVAAVPERALWRKLPAPARALLAAVADPPRDVLIALRDRAGDVVDIERRWYPAERPASERKTKRSPGQLVGQHLGTVMFGSLPLAVRAAQAGEPVVLVEGSRDFIAAWAACQLRQRGAVLGAPGADDMPKVASALVLALREAGVRPGAAQVCVVPDVGDHLDDPDNRGWRVGERRAWAAAVQLCEIARAWWCPPVDRRGDLCDALADAADPVPVFWSIIERGQTVLDAGDDLDRWAGATDKALVAASWRLPVGALIEYLRWYRKPGKEGEEDQLVRAPRIPASRGRNGDTRLGQAVLAWMAHHRIRFLNTDEGCFVWDPLEIARRPPHAPDEPAVPPRQIPRLFLIKSRRYWDGWLQEIGWINPATGEGRTIERAIQQAAQRAVHSELASWLTAEGTLRAPVVRLHLHTRMENVLAIRQGAVAVEPNGHGRRILIASEEVEAPIEWLAGTNDAAERLYRRVGAHLTVTRPERAMVVAWLLMAPLRELVKDRPILWATGESGAGKSFGAALINALMYGVAEAGHFTTAALWDLGRREPLLCLDNKEGAFIDDALLELFLTASTGVKRRMRGQAGDRGTVGQRFKAAIHLSAIGRPLRDDLQRRCLLIEHQKQLRNDGHRPAEVIDALLADRSALWSGIARLFADAVIPRLAAGDHTRMADRVPPDHPIEGMREALGVMAVIADVLCAGCAAWGTDGATLLADWLGLTQHRIRDIRESADPLRLALDELLGQWNRRVEDRFSGGRYRPAFSESLFVCQPLFRVEAGRRMVAGDPAHTVEIDHAEKDADGFAVVVGFVGTYQQLYRDLGRVVREAAVFREAVGGPDVLGAKIGAVEGWSSAVWRKPNRGARVYRWVGEEECR